MSNDYKFHIVLFNGPPLVGKDTLAKYAIELNPDARHVKYVSTLKQAVSALFNYPIETQEENKDDEAYRRYDKTIREHQISLGLYLRNTYGADILGRLLAARIGAMYKGTPFVTVSDLRTKDELGPIVNAFTHERVTVVRLHQEGCTWEDPAYSYITDTFGAKAFDIQNPKGDRAFAKLLVKALIERIQQ